MREKKHIFTTGRVDPFTQHGRQRQTQTLWYYLAGGTAQPILLQKYCHLVARVSILLLKDIFLIRRNVDDFSVDDTFALEHGGNGACGIPDGDTIIMTGGFGQNYVTRFVLELEVAGLENISFTQHQILAGTTQVVLWRNFPSFPILEGAMHVFLSLPAG